MDGMHSPLDERKEHILREIVEAYVKTGEPVASRSVADGSELGVSSATVRNEMGILEREGYITHPHTSAGRVPTDKGYRYYVDVLAPRVAADPEQAREIKEFLSGTLSALDELLQRASQILVDMTSYLSLAAAPPVGEARVRHVQLVELFGPRVFLVVVGEEAWHEEHVLELDADTSEEAIRRAVETANRLVGHKTLIEAAEALENAEVEPDVQQLLVGTAQALRLVARKGGRVFTGGTSRLVVWEPAPAASRLLEILETGEVQPLLPQARPEHVSVRIGRELALEDLHDLSLIAAGYRFGQQAGTLGVLGPTRMDYPAVISTVAEVARTLSRALREYES